MKLRSSSGTGVVRHSGEKNSASEGLLLLETTESLLLASGHHLDASWNHDQQASNVRLVNSAHSVRRLKRRSLNRVECSSLLS